MDEKWAEKDGGGGGGGGRVKGVEQVGGEKDEVKAEGKEEVNEGNGNESCEAGTAAAAGRSEGLMIYYGEDV